MQHGLGERGWRSNINGEWVSGPPTLPDHELAANRRDFEGNPINAVVVRRWQGKDYGPGGNTVFLTTALLACSGGPTGPDVRGGA